MALWDDGAALQFSNEADVETRLVLPLLLALGYSNADIASKYPVRFFTGRKGRPHEADFVVFSGSECTIDTSLIVIEAKPPTDALDDAKFQAESYVTCLRAPLYVLTNGVDLEVWQFQSSRASDQILNIKIAALGAHRGQIETALSKNAVLNYCQKLEIKKIPLTQHDWTAYEKAELERTRRMTHDAAKRTLTLLASQKAIASEDLFQMRRGVHVVAASGFGKSFLATQLLEYVLEARLTQSGAKLPIEVPLPDVKALKTSIQTYVFERLRAYSPGFTLNALEDMLRIDGAVLVCDALDRVLPAERGSVEAELRTILRDYPLVQVILFSQPHVGATIDLPMASLDELAADQQQTIVRNVRNVTSADAAHFMIGLPPFLKRLCQHPLFLTLLARSWRPGQEPAPSILDLFRSWLDRLINSDNPDITAQASREQALHVLATATVETPLPVMEATRVLAGAGCPADALDALINNGGVVKHGGTIQLAHEALGDYLRAIQIATGSADLVSQRIDEAPLRPDSLFPLLLLSLLSERECRQQLWKRVASLPLQAYLYVVRYASSPNKQDAPNATRAAVELAEDITSGFMLPLSRYFPQLQRVSSPFAARTPADAVHCIAMLTTDLAWLTYKYSANPGSLDQQSDLNWRSLDLRANALTLDSGRLVGATDLLSFLRQVIKQRAMTGGTIWNEEWLLSRLRYLGNTSGVDLLAADLAEIEAFLERHRDTVFLVADEVPCAVAEVLEYVRRMRATGCTKLNVWWPDNSGNIEDVTIAAALDEHYRRVQLAYTEVVNSTFSDVRSELPHAQLFPVRWKISITPSALFPEARTLHWTYTPVADLQHAGADVTFGEPPRSIDFAVEAETISARLRDLGRSPGHYATHGFGPMPTFDGRTLITTYDGETTVLKFVCELLRDDVTAAFEPIRDARVALMSFTDFGL